MEGVHSITFGERPLTIVLNNYNRLISYLLPAATVSAEQLRKNRMLVSVCLLTSLVALLYVPTAALVDYKPAMLFMSISFVVHLFTLLLFKKGLGHAFCGNLYVFNNTFIAIAPCVYFSGGFASPATPWFALININALLLFGLSRNTYVWLSVNTLTILGFGAAEFFGHTFPIMYDSSHYMLFMLLCILGLSFIIFLVTTVFERTSVNALNLLTIYNEKIEAEKQRSEQLLLNILPASIADRLREGEQPIADHFDEASVVFIDIVNFTPLSSSNEPKAVVELLNRIFTQIDQISARYELEKIKTIGDSYMAASGIPLERKDHAVKAIEFARDVLKELNDYYTPNGEKVEFRIGLNCGPVIAGVIGERKFIYDLWGDAVNIAARMESHGVVNKIHCTQQFHEALLAQGVDLSEFQDRGFSEIKGKGQLKTWLTQ